MLDLDPEREGPPPRDAATVIALRDGDGDGDGAAGASVEVFCVERNQKSKFLGGAIVFPGGRVEDADRDEAWAELCNDPAHPLRAFAIAGCRETMEEAALLFADTELEDADVVALRSKIAEPLALQTFLRERGVRLDVRALVPLARWVTPKVEGRRFDARFFVARAPRGQSGAHDMNETMASFWDTPAHVLERFDKSEIQLAPPTHRTLMQLATCKSTGDALAMARAASLEPICPELVQQDESLALVLPGDRQHSVREARVPGPSRYVLRGAHWRAEGV
jgi:8-oxo-dGTP pyrophosphatase MutT (NUDIX family)